jgi:hypothetical protein
MFYPLPGSRTRPYKPKKHNGLESLEPRQLNLMGLTLF